MDIIFSVDDVQSEALFVQSRRLSVLNRFERNSLMSVRSKILSALAVAFAMAVAIPAATNQAAAAPTSATSGIHQYDLGIHQY